MNSQEQYLTKAWKRYHKALAKPESPGDLLSAKDYLTERGIFTNRVIGEYGLGVVLNPLAGDERFQGMLSIPYQTRNGVKALKFRNLNAGAKPKYAQRAGQEVRLYNTKAYFAATDVIGIAEGEMDAIVATEHLGIPTIGIPGAEMWKAHKEFWAPVFRNFQKVLVFRDGDDAGKSLAEAVTDSLGYRCRVIDPPDGEDVGSMVGSGRTAELSAKLADNDNEEGEEDGD